MLFLVIPFDLYPFFSDLAVDSLDFGHFFHEEVSFGDRQQFFVDLLVVA